MRKFLAGLAREVRAGRIEVHAYCLMTTHLHLLLRSPLGKLSDVMQRVENDYARWFNRSRRRDGPLFRGRFTSKAVRNHEYRVNVVRYIDFNPVHARLAPSPAAYPFCSARWYASRRGPPWLARDWIEAQVRDRQEKQDYDPADYLPVFGRPGPGMAKLIESRLQRGSPSTDPLEELLQSGHVEMLGWMRKKAELADGTGIGLPVCTPFSVAEVVARGKAENGEWHDPLCRKRISAWPQAATALLRDLCGSTWSEAARGAGSSPPAARRAYERHRRSLARDDEYARRLARLADEVLRQCHGPLH